MRPVTESLGHVDAPVAAAIGLGGALALYGAYALARSRPSSSSKVHTLNAHSALLGDYLEFTRNAPRLHDWLAETSLRFHGEPWRIHLPGLKNMVMLTNPALIHDVTTAQFDTFVQGDAANEAAVDLFGNSLVTNDGEAWYHQRKAAAKFFTARSLRTCMTTHMRKNMGHVYDVIDRTIATGASIDMLKLFHEFALQAFAEVGLGIDLPLIGNGEPHPMEDAIEIVTPVLLRRAALPQFYWKLERWLGVGPEKDLADAMRRVRTWLGAVVAQSLDAAAARQGSSAGGDEIKSVVELFLEQSSEDKEGLRADNLEDFILSFLIAARQTSAMALTWTFLMLAKHPHVEGKIRAELAALELDDDAYVTGDDTQKLVYLEATIKEVLRLYPTVPLSQRETLADTTIGDGVHIRKGDFVLLHPYTLARLPGIWGPDAAEFKPERWIDDATGELRVVPNTHFMTFGSGPRICIGMKLAMLELRVVMANLLKRYNFSLAVPNNGSHVVALELMLVEPLLMAATRVRQE